MWLREHKTHTDREDMVYSPITQPASVIEEGSKLLDPFVLNVPLFFSISYKVSALSLSMWCC